MVITSTNINKTKQSLNSDGQKFHQYQQNEQSLFHFFFIMKSCDSKIVFLWTVTI